MQVQFHVDQKFASTKVKSKRWVRPVFDSVSQGFRPPPPRRDLTPRGQIPRDLAPPGSNP